MKTSAALPRFTLLFLLLLPLSAPVTRGAEPDQHRAAVLRAAIARQDALYFGAAAPEITDAEYDGLKRELRQLEQAHPELERAPEGVGDDRNGLFAKRRHVVPLLSLDKIYSEAEWRRFHASLAARFGSKEVPLVVEPKYDGLAVSLTYVRGELVQAVTRGNGREGDDVTANLLALVAVPRRLRPEAVTGAPNPIPNRVELRGEVYVDLAEFRRLNAERVAAGEEPFAHPRNYAAGTLKAREADTTGRSLALVIYGWGAWEGAGLPATQSRFHEQVVAWGLPAVHVFQSGRTADDGWGAIEWFRRQREQFGFPVDGAVVKLDEVARRAAVGANDHAPRWAIAFKYAPDRAATRLRAITLQVGRSGVITPVAELDPVEVGGATVRRVMLHNRREIERRDLRVGDLVEVERSSEVIPAIVGVDRARRTADSRPYAFPASCPACQRALRVRADEVAVRCVNHACPEQVQRRLEHFASAMGLDGFGPATVAALRERGWLGRLADFYALDPQRLQQLPSVGVARAEHLLASVHASRDVELERVLVALGVPDLGRVGARRVAQRCGSLRAVRALASAAPAALELEELREVRRFLLDDANAAEVDALIRAGVGEESRRENAAR